MKKLKSLRAAGTLLRASLEDRVLEYLLLPYGEEGRTNVGKVIASSGSVEVPDDPTTLVANLEHEPTRPVARFVRIEERNEGMVASLRVLETTAGNDLLVEAAEGVRTGISVEVANPVIRDGKLVGGVLSGAGFVTTPAFPSAQLVAADAGDVPEDYESTSTTVETVVIDGVEYERKTTSAYTTETTLVDGEPPAEDEDEDPTPQEETVTASRRVATVPPGTLSARRSPSSKVTTKGDLFKLLASAHARGGERAMLAALSDVVPGDILGIEQPQYVRELWSGKAYERRFVPLFNHAELTSFEVRGWRWVTKPAVAPYAGDKADVPSNDIATEQVTITAERIAGAHDIDRKFRDFNDVEFFEAYFAAMTESYAKVSDAQVLADVLAAATEVEHGEIPTGVNQALTMIVDGALKVLDETDTMPQFAVVASNLWRDLVLTRQEDRLAYLDAALGVEEGTAANFRILPSSALTASTVLVGARDAVTVHELGGEAPIRVEAQHIAQGGVDEGVFGYYAVNVHDEDGLVLVTEPEE